MQDSDFEDPTEGTNENRSPGLSDNSTASLIATALNQGDHETAGNLLREALAQSPDDQQLLRLSAKQRRQAERFTRVYSLLKETREAIQGDEFVRAVGAYREAANLSQGFTKLEQAAFDVGVEQAGELGDRNWRIARTLLDDAGRLNPELVVPEKRWKDVRAAEREETIANVLEETALAKPAELGRARERLMRTLEQYPEDTSLAKRLKSIESTIEEKNRWDERQKCLKKLIDLRDAMQRETDPAEVDKYIAQSEALAAPYTGEAEFSNVVEDVRHQVMSSERAAAALKQDRIDDCLEECAWVLSRMRHHQLFLNLKKQAEERELSLADEYSNSVSRIEELLAAGQLAEAESLCAKASASLPQFADLQELKREIAERRLKADHQSQERVDNVRRLVERGERSLRENQYRLAEQSFSGALKLSPEDKNLSGHLVGLLHGYARSIVSDNPQSAEEVLQLMARILPGTAVPTDLAAAVRQKREHAKEEAVRWASLDKIASLNAQVESAKKREEVQAARSETEKHNFATASHHDVREAVAILNQKIEGKTAELAVRQARRPAIYRAISIAAMLLLGVGLAYWLNNNHPTSSVVPTKPRAVEATVAVAKRPAEAEISAPAPTQAAVPSSSFARRSEESGAQLTPMPARLEIRGAEPETRIKLDGVLLGNTRAHRVTKELPAGEHSIEISRDGFLTKTLTRNLAPGEALVLTGRDVQLESSDALAEVATAKQADDLQWQAVDKNNPDSLRAFVERYPNSTWSSEAKRQINSVLMAREDSDWNGVDRNSSAALQDFLKKHPYGRYTASASSALAEIERKAELARAQSAEEGAWKKVNPRDEASLESYLRDFPGSHYRNQAEVELATIRLGRSSANETAAVLTVINRLASAWSARDMDSILALQRNLSKREVRAELSHVRELAMQISPASPPQIDGAQAVVLCRRQASQTFSDGTRKQIPESIVSYVLAKRDGSWTIEGTR